MRMYETVAILQPEVTDDRVVALVAKLEGLVEGSGGKIAEVDQWGVRRLAYHIGKQSKGYYTLVKYAAAPTIINEIERTLKLAEDCIRYMTVNLDQEVGAEELAAIQKVHKKSAVAPDDHEAAPDAEGRSDDEAPAGSSEPAAKDEAPEAADDDTKEAE